MEKQWKLSLNYHQIPTLPFPPKSPCLLAILMACLNGHLFAHTVSSSYRHLCKSYYCNDPKFSGWQVWANSADPDQRSSPIRVYTVCHAVCIFRMHHTMVKPHCSNFRIITASFRVSEILGLLQCSLCHHWVFGIFHCMWMSVIIIIRYSKIYRNRKVYKCIEVSLKWPCGKCFYKKLNGILEVSNKFEKEIISKLIIKRY